MASPLNRSGWYDLSGKGLKELPNGLAIGFINGIQNSFDDFEKSLLHLSKLSGGYNIQGVYGASVEPPCGEMFGLLGQRVIDTCRSFAADLGTCLFGMMHVDTGRVQHLHAMWDAHFDRHPDGYFLQFYHSRGGIDMTNALLCYSEERRKKIIGVGIAPARYPFRETCLNVINYRADWTKDLVPYMDVRGSVRAQNTIITLFPDASNNTSAHTFINPMYEEPIQNNIEFLFNIHKGQ